MHVLVGEAWADRYATWRHEVEGKVGAGQDVTLELEEGALILDDLAARLTGEDAERVARAADAVRRTSCSLDVRLNAALDEAVGRSAERRLGEECVSACRSSWAPDPKQTTLHKTYNDQQQQISTTTQL